MKNVLLISPFFLPSNLAGVHRVRVMSRSLEAHGWRPTIVTVAPAFYEEPSDASLNHLLLKNARIERVFAWPARFCRRFGFGDISLRAQWQLRRRVAQLVMGMRPAAIFATVLPGYTALVGSWAKRRFNVPFVLDYQDPWVPNDSERLSWNKTGLTTRLALRLEPRILRDVDALTAVSDDTLASLRNRKLIRQELPIEIIPIGADRRDHEVAMRHGRSLIARDNDAFRIAYLGTLTNRMLPALRSFLAAVATVSRQTSRAIVVHLIGTSARPAGEDRYDLQGLAREVGVSEQVHLHPARVGYLDALRTMHDADLLLLIGSTDSHYTASKFFPYWLSGKPIVGLFHRASQIVQLSADLGGAKLVLYDDEHGPETKTPEAALTLVGIINGTATVPSRNEAAFAPYSAEGIAARYARLFDKVAKK